MLKLKGVGFSQFFPFDFYSSLMLHCIVKHLAWAKYAGYEIQKHG